MRRKTQTIKTCSHCGRQFEDGEDYWEDSLNNCYCLDNKCGWEDEEDE